jgi:cytochrome c553
MGSSSRTRARRRNLFLAAALLATTGCAEPPGREERAVELFGYCTQCHGEAAEGTLDYRAPGIAGLPAWYVAAQLEKFRVGARGDHPDDVEGLRMRPMSRTLGSAAEVQLVAEYVASFPRHVPVPTVEGDADRGQALFTPCVQCHGDRAQGNRAMNAPPLTGSDDWYLITQLHKFREGIRGTDPADATGAQMRPNAVALADEQAMRDVVAYVMRFQDE